MRKVMIGLLALTGLIGASSVASAQVELLSAGPALIGPGAHAAQCSLYAAGSDNPTVSGAMWGNLAVEPVTTGCDGALGQNGLCGMSAPTVGLAFMSCTISASSKTNLRGTLAILDSNNRILQELPLH